MRGKGLAFTDSIDMVFSHDETGELVLVMLATDSWIDDETEKLLQLQAKLNTYLDYVLDGHLGQDFPDAVEKPVRILLRSTHIPTGPVLEFLERAQNAVAKYNVAFGYEVPGFIP